MRELPMEFVGVGEVRDFKFRQIESTAFGYIYEVVMPESGLRHWEVFRRMENVRFGCVSYPKSKSFGAWAWTCDTLERAREVLASLSERGSAEEDVEYEDVEEEE